MGLLSFKNKIMASQYFNNQSEYCCTVTDFTPAVASVGLETHTFTLDVGTNGALVFNNATVAYDDLAGNSGSEVATGTYPNMSVDITWPAAGTYYLTIISTFTDGAPACEVKLEGTVEVS